MKCGDCKYFELIRPESKESWGKCVWVEQHTPLSMPFWAQNLVPLQSSALSPFTGGLSENLCACYQGANQEASAATQENESMATKEMRWFMAETQQFWEDETNKQTD